MALIERTAGAGGDIANFRAARVMLEAASPLADDYTFDQISTFNEPAAWPGGVLRENGKTVTFTCSYNKGKNFLDQYKINLSPDVGLEMTNNVQEAGFTIWEYLFPVRTFVNIIGNSVIIATSSAVAAGSHTSIVRNCNIKGFYSVAKGDRGIKSVRERSGLQIYNCKIWNCWRGIDLKQGVLSIGDFTNKYAENVTLYNSIDGVYVPYGGYANYLRCKNVVSIAATTNDWSGLGGLASVLAENCADSDGTLAAAPGSNNQLNIVPADEYESFDDTKSNFLRKKKGSMVFTSGAWGYTPAGLLGHNGTAPDFAGATDIAGLPRPGESGNYAIGAEEQQYGGGPDDKPGGIADLNLAIDGVPNPGMAPVDVAFTSHVSVPDRIVETDNPVEDRIVETTGGSIRVVEP